MENIITYLEKYGDQTFTQMNFNEVDALILSQFSYLKLDGYIPSIGENKEPVTLPALASCMDEKAVFCDARYEKDNRLLFFGMLESRRFSSMKMNYYASVIDTDVETQFCALTFFFEDACPVVIYRGTDESFVGWREDFNMAFTRPVAGQFLAKKYLDKVGTCLGKPFLVGGHSKGGNFAVYAAMNVSEELKKQILRIYSFDGPGFRPEILKSGDYDSISDRIFKYIPGSSVVGMLLEEHEDYRIVECHSVGLLQHNPYNWLVRDNGFIKRESLYKSSQFMDRAINEWILTLNDEQLKLFGETLFHILEGCEMQNMIEIAASPKKGINNMIRALKEVDEESREKIYQILKILGDILKDNARAEHYLFSAFKSS